MAEADPVRTKHTRADGTPVAINEKPVRSSKLRGRILMVSVPIVVLAIGGYVWATSGRSVSTDNAYVKRDISSVGTDVTGRVVDVRVRENQMVKQGDVLFVVDPEPYKVALEQANAAIANAQVDVGKLREDYTATSADIEGAKSDLFFAQEDLKRQQALMDQGFTTRTRLQQSQQAVATAQKVLNNALSEAAKAKAALATGAQVPGVNPQVAAAMAQRDQAALNLQRTVVRAPISGRASQTERLQVGQMAVQGLPLVSLVASEKSWITANFKETDLDKMCPGQPADIKLDAYPNLKLTGRVTSIGGGTGSQFSILPAQNANGNWVKVTQRVPVRIDVDGDPARTMIAGLSAKVTVKFTHAAQAAQPGRAKAMALNDDQPHLATKHKGLLTTVIMSAMVMQVLDTTITNVALPHMQASLGAAQDTISWVLTSYILASAVAIPITGWLADRFGTRRLFIVSVALFVLASMLCGVAQSLEQMVIFRALQGLGGAFLGPLAQSLMLDINKPSQQARAMSVYGMGVMVGPIMGPIVGGWLTENLDWRWCFYVNVPVGVACLLGLVFLLPEKPLRNRDFDIFGFALLALGLASLQLMLDRGQSQDWFSATEIWVETGMAAICLWMFGVHSMTAKKPLFDPMLVADRNFVTGAIFMFIIGMIMLAALAILPPLIENIYGYSVTDTGVILAARGVGVLATMSIVGKLMSYIDARILVASGFVISAGSLFMMTGWALGHGLGTIVLSGLIQGLGIGLTFVPLQVLAFGTLPPSFRTEGAAVLNLTRNIGSSIGIAVVMALLARNMQVSHQDIAGNITATSLPIDPAQLLVLGQYGSAALGALDGMVQQQAAMIAYLDDFKLMAIACIAAAPLALLLRKPKPRPPGGGPAPVMAE